LFCYNLLCVLCTVVWTSDPLGSLSAFLVLALFSALSLGLMSMVQSGTLEAEQW
jgi:hypothetical protein